MAIRRPPSPDQMRQLHTRCMLRDHNGRHVAVTELPLTGITVLEIDPTPAGAVVGQVLADYGAAVYLVEPPTGAAIRKNKAFPFWGRGKKSLPLDLSSHEGVEQLLALAERADVLIDTKRPGSSYARGYGYPTVAARAPHIIYASITGFGELGPLANLKGYEGLVLAKLGVLNDFRAISNRPGPSYVSVPYASYTAAHTALHGILTSLYERETSGLGQRIEANLAQGYASMDTWQWFNQVITDRYPDAYQATTLFDEDGVPAGPFVYLLLVALTKDGKWLQFAQTQPRLFRAFLIELGLENLPTEPKWAGFPQLEDPGLRLELWEIMLNKVRERTLAEWQETFDRNPDVYAEQYAHGEGVLDHPQLLFDGQIIELDDPRFGKVRQPREVATFADRGTPNLQPAPALSKDEDVYATALDAIEPRRPSTSSSAPRGLPLDGITIVELGFMYAGPYASTLLTDLGARVIKIEPLEGDEIRRLQPFPETGGAKVMQGKESIAIDITTPDGKKVALALLGSADVVLEAYRAGVADRLGVGAEAVKELNPAAIYLHAPGYGVGGPCGHRPAYAPSIGAAGGFARTNVGPSFHDGPDLDMQTVREGAIALGTASLRTSAQADGTAAVTVATTILLALFGRARGQGGREIFTSMLATAVHVIPNEFMTTTTGESNLDDATDAFQLGLGPLYRLYEAAEGWIFLAAPKDKEWKALVAATSEWIDLAHRDEFATAELRKRNAQSLASELQVMFKAKPAAEWERYFTALDIGCVEVATDETVKILQSELGRESGYVANVVHPVFEEHPRLAPLTRFSRSATQAKAACLAGAHNEKILAELNYSPEDIAGFRERTIIT
jgi:crotonobetainyl-CoA:carnitine CoA-transferase CaiB-like acyl-CoA transferase